MRLFLRHVRMESIHWTTPNILMTLIGRFVRVHSCLLLDYWPKDAHHSDLAPFCPHGWHSFIASTDFAIVEAQEHLSIIIRPCSRGCTAPEIVNILLPMKWTGPGMLGEKLQTSSGTWFCKQHEILSRTPWPIGLILISRIRIFSWRSRLDIKSA